MKRSIIILVLLLLFVEPTYSETVEGVITTGDITINGEKIDNSKLDYPFITYNNITYVPMTFNLSQTLGLKTTWSQSTGLNIKLTEVKKMQLNYEGNHTLGSKVYPTIAEGVIFLDSQVIDNSKEEYPILNYNDVCYFPLTYDYVVKKFNWKVVWGEIQGLRIATKYYNAIYTAEEVVEEKAKEEPLSPVQLFASELDESVKVHYMHIEIKGVNDTYKLDLRDVNEPTVLLLPCRNAIKFRIYDPNSCVKGIIYSGDERIKFLDYEGPQFRVEDIDGGVIFPTSRKYGEKQVKAYEDMAKVMDFCLNEFGRRPDYFSFKEKDEELDLYDVIFDDEELEKYEAGLEFVGVMEERVEKANVPEKDYMTSNESKRDLFYKKDIEIPLNAFRKFTFDETSDNYSKQLEDHGNTQYVIDSFYDQYRHHVDYSKRGTYYIGEFEFDESSTKIFKILLRNSKCRLLVDGKFVGYYRYNSNVDYAFSKGKHVIEIEIYHINNNPGSYVKLVDIDPVKLTSIDASELKDLVTEDTIIDYVMLKDSNNNVVELNVSYENEPRIVFINSKYPIKWKIDSFPGNIKAIVAGYEIEKPIIIADEVIPVCYVLGLPKAENVYLDYSIASGEINPYLFEDLNKMVQELTGDTLDSFSYLYSANSIDTNQIWLTKEKYEEIKEENEALRLKIEE